MRDQDNLPPHTPNAGDTIYAAGCMGSAWLLVSGSIRLDRIESNGERAFAGLAIKGDVLGAETLLLGHYAFTATALTPCELRPWPGAAVTPEPRSLLKALADAERRGADAIALRCGEAATRVGRLIRILANSLANQTITRRALPALTEMADITALTVGTVSRTLSIMQAEGTLAAHDSRRGRPPSSRGRNKTPNFAALRESQPRA